MPVAGKDTAKALEAAEQGLARADVPGTILFLTDGIEPGAASILVDSKGAPPQMFREGIGVVVEGTLDGETFKSERVLVNHSNEYKPPHGNDASANYGAATLK